MGKIRELMGNIIEIFNGLRAINFIHKIFNLYFSAKSLAIFTLITFQGLLAFPTATKDLNNKLYRPPIASVTQKADKMPLSNQTPHTINYFPPHSTFGQSIFL